MTIQFNPKKGTRGIEWTDRVTASFGGCMHDCKWVMPSGEVAICYAKSIAESIAAPAYPNGFEHHYFRENGLKAIPTGKEPELRFVDSMSDLFAANVPENDVRRTLAAIADAPHHAFQSLTKAAPQLLKYVSDLPPNLWVGVSSPPDWFMGHALSHPQQKALLKVSLDVLDKIRDRTGNIVWMSAEPVSWDLTDVIDSDHPLDWIVIGAASSGKKYFQPAVKDVLNLLIVMDATTTPVFYKGNIRPLIDGQAKASKKFWRWREDFPMTYRDESTIPAVARRQQRCKTLGWTESRFYAAKKIDASGSMRNRIMDKLAAPGELERLHDSLADDSMVQYGTIDEPPVSNSIRQDPDALGASVE